MLDDQIITENNKANCFNIGLGTQNVRFMKISTFKYVNVKLLGSGTVYPEGDNIPARMGNNQTLSIVPSSGQRI